MSFDPPTRFDSASAVILPEGVASGTFNLAGGMVGQFPAVLYGRLLYVGNLKEMTVIDVRTGRTEAAIGGDNTSVGSARRAAERPVLADVGGTPTVLTALYTAVKGSGTTAARNLIELVGVDAATAERLWSIPIPSDDASPEDPVAVAGVSGGTAVLRAGTMTYGVDLLQRKVAWQNPNFVVGAVADGTAVGVLHDDPVRGRLSGFSAADGKLAWRDRADVYAASVRPVSPTLVAFHGNAYGSGAPDDRLLAAATGKTVTREFITDTCAYDGVGIAVCSGANETVSVDAATGKRLWAITPDGSGRTAVRVTAARKGLLYGSTENGPVVVDARTGEDREVDPGAAPYLVNGSVGIARNPQTYRIIASPAIA
ncbi:PQQ-binding-like beta-propeller repeat protein [Actinoplanes sp. NPDC049802]|uniref:PQQ-binding-like beta-propeller repeat protein n=1 Tax=Actinoplanes sp. NPDC049802 TaxID=3154742 RepID=UPI0033C40453